jgi:hypothetical protein
MVLSREFGSNDSMLLIPSEPQLIDERGGVEKSTSDGADDWPRWVTLGDILPKAVSYIRIAPSDPLGRHLMPTTP